MNLIVFPDTSLFSSPNSLALNCKIIKPNNQDSDAELEDANEISKEFENDKTPDQKLNIRRPLATLVSRGHLKGLVCGNWGEVTDFIHALLSIMTTSNVECLDLPREKRGT